MQSPVRFDLQSASEQGNCNFCSQFTRPAQLRYVESRQVRAFGRHHVVGSVEYRPSQHPVKRHREL
jgi:hypothetical protein